MSRRDEEVNVRRSLGHRLRELRLARGLTQAELGDRSGLAAKYMSELERGLRNPSLRTLHRVARHGLGTTLAVLLFEVDEPAGRSSRRGASRSGALRAAEPLGDYLSADTVLAGRSVEQRDGLLEILRRAADLLDASAPADAHSGERRRVRHRARS